MKNGSVHEQASMFAKHSDRKVDCLVGIHQEVALKHKGTGVIGHNAFHDIPVMKVLQGAGIIAAGVAVGGGIAMHGGVSDPVKILQAAMHGAATYAVNADGADVPKLVEAAVQKMQPDGALAAKCFMSFFSPGKGVIQLHAHCHCTWS